MKLFIILNYFICLIFSPCMLLAQSDSLNTGMNKKDFFESNNDYFRIGIGGLFSNPLFGLDIFEIHSRLSSINLGGCISYCPGFKFFQPEKLSYDKIYVLGSPDEIVYDKVEFPSGFSYSVFTGYKLFQSKEYKIFKGNYAPKSVYDEVKEGFYGKILGDTIGHYMVSSLNLNIELLYSPLYGLNNQHFINSYSQEYILLRDGYDYYIIPKIRYESFFQVEYYSNPKGKNITDIGTNYYELGYIYSPEYQKKGFVINGYFTGWRSTFGFYFSLGYLWYNNEKAINESVKPISNNYKNHMAIFKLMLKWIW